MNEASAHFKGLTGKGEVMRTLKRMDTAKTRFSFLRPAALCFLGLSMILLLSAQGYAQRTTLVRFKGVETPFTLKHGDSVIEKGKYDFEISLLVQGSQMLFYLTMKKDKETICDVLGERFKYDSDYLPALSQDPKIPEKPSLTFKINAQEKTFLYIFETGKAGAYPFERAKFRFDYEL